MRTLAVVVPPPAFDHDLGLRQRVEDLAVEQFVPELTSVTPIARTASATGRPCAVSTSTCRSLATISSAVCRFLAILASSSWRKAIPQGGPLLRGQATGTPSVNLWVVYYDSQVRKGVSIRPGPPCVGGVS